MSNLQTIITTLDTRASTDDDLTFQIRFAEFNNAESNLEFTTSEAALPADELAEIARNRYSDLRDQVLAEHGWTPAFDPGPSVADDDPEGPA